MDKSKLFTRERVVYTNGKYSLVLMEDDGRLVLNFVVIEAPLEDNSIVNVLNWRKVDEESLRKDKNNWYLFFFRRKIKRLSAEKKHIYEGVISGRSTKKAKLQKQLLPMVWIAESDGEACILTAGTKENIQVQDEVFVEEFSLYGSKKVSVLM